MDFHTLWPELQNYYRLAGCALVSASWPGGRLEAGATEPEIVLEVCALEPASVPAVPKVDGYEVKVNFHRPKRVLNV